MRIFFLILPVIASFSYCSIQPEPDLTARWNLLGNIIRVFIGSQASISVFDIDKAEKLMSRKSTLHKVLNSITPLLVYGSLNDSLVEQISDMGEELEVPSTSKSYVVMSASTRLIEGMLEMFSKINANGKWVFSLVQVDEADVEALLIRAWNKFKMANILTIFSDQKQNVTLYVKSFNPFRLEGNQHGTFFTEVVKIETLPAILTKLDGIFESKVRNLQSFPLKAVMFQESSDQNEILDNEMKRIFEKMLNANFTVHEPADKKFHGTRLPNGSFTGALEEIEGGKADIVLNNRLLSNVSSSRCAFLHPISATDMKYVIVKEPQPTNLLHFHLVQAFDLETKFAYLATFLAVGIVWHYLNVWRARLTGQICEKEDFFKLSLCVIGIQSSVAIAMRRTRQSHQRILICSLLIFSLITCNSFQGVILNNLTNPKKTVNINTLNELLASDLNLTALISIPDLFKPNEGASNVNQMQLKLYARQTIDNELSVEEVQAKGLLQRSKQAVLMRSQYAVDLVNVDFNNATGESLYHIVNESPISFFTTYIVPKSSPFIVTLNRAILSAREFGFLSFVNMKIRSHLDISRMKRYMKKSLTFKSTSAITMGHMRHIFTFYLVCISICCFVFILEILHKRISTRRAPIPFAH